MVTTEVTKKTRQMHRINQVTNAIISERTEHRQQQKKVFISTRYSKGFST